MKLFPNLVTSATSCGTGVTYTWSSALDVGRHLKNETYNLQWDVDTSATTVTLTWSGCTSAAGTYIESPTVITSGATSGSGPTYSGVSFISFTPELFPWMKIGAKATGTTSTISCHLIVG